MTNHPDTGSPLGVAVIGVDNLDVSTAFYRDIIGLDASEADVWKGPEFETLWHLPKGATARAVLCGDGDDPVGRILLLEFDAENREYVRTGNERRAYSLFNLNFYTADIFGAHRDLSAAGFKFWSEPILHDFTEDVGSPVEVIFEGPDNVPINLVELRGGGPDTRIGQMRAYVEKRGSTKTGYTPVVTSAHCVQSREKAVAFYTGVLGMEIMIDEELFSEEANHFLNTAPGSRTHITFVGGAHMFGKVALSHPVNYDVPNLIPRAHAPNIGYLAQMFDVADLAAAESAAEQIPTEPYASRQDNIIPRVGPRQTVAYRNPGSGAIMILMAE
jgi:catechol 2,3-dioxygenase-like lactoylglutathione lyase family enzyme